MSVVGCFMVAKFAFLVIMAAMFYALLQAFFINGVKISSLGSTEVDPQGKDRDGEMILYPLYKFLTQSYQRRVYYNGERLDALLDQIDKLSPWFKIVRRKDVNVSPRTTPLPAFYVTYSAMHFRPDAYNLEKLDTLIEDIKKMDPEIIVAVNREGGFALFCKEYTEYRFSKYLRKPIIQCIVCMASFWTIFTYWIPALYFFGPSLPLVYIGIINTFVVAYLNYVVFNSQD